MKIDILTLFPLMFDGFLNSSIIKRAIENNKVTINIHDIRSYSKDPHKKVDDYSFGGGAGMVLMPQPIFDAVDDLKNEDSYVILLTPQGKQYNQTCAKKLLEKKHIIIICGHYEGFDERIRTLADVEYSIGDYILTGGELASMVITDSVTRLIDGVITSESHQNDSFENNLLDYPVYTKPVSYRGMDVPEVLLNGNHKLINEYRLKESLRKTYKRRPDLLKNKILTDYEKKLLDEIMEEEKK